MSNLLALYLLIAHGLPATTYGYGERHCCDVGVPCSCSVGTVTASGEAFDPAAATAAVFAPFSLRLTAVDIWVRLETQTEEQCVKIHVNDKGNPRFIGTRGFDITPGALRALGLQPSPHWTGRLYLCERTLNEVIKYGKTKTATVPTYWTPYWAD